MNTERARRYMRAERAAEAIVTVLADYGRRSKAEIMQEAKPRLTSAQFNNGWRYLRATLGTLVAMEHHGPQGAVYFCTTELAEAEQYDLWLSRHVTTRTGSLRDHVLTRVDFATREGDLDEMLAAVADEERLVGEVEHLRDMVRSLGLRLGHTEAEVESWLSVAA